MLQLVMPRIVNRYAVLIVWCFSQCQLLAISYCYDNCFSWYPATDGT